MTSNIKKMETWLIRYKIARLMGWKLYKVRRPSAVEGSPYLWHSPDDDRVPNDQWPEHKELEPYEELRQRDFKGVPDYPADIAAAWLVLGKMLERQGRDRLIINIAMYWGSGSWVHKCELLVETRRQDWVGRADTTPLAICYAVLIATERD